MSHCVDIHAPGLPAERRSLEREAVWVTERGRGALLVRSEAQGVTPDVELIPGDQGVLVRRRVGAAVRVRVHGSEVPEALIPWGDEVFLDDTRLAFLARSSAGKSRPLVLLLALVVAAGALFATSRARSGAGAPAGEDAAPPPLHAPIAACSVTGAPSSEARAFEAERLALAKRARYAFASSDGVAALPLLEEAATCFRDAGRIEDARRARATLDEWSARLNADYASLTLELRAALAEKRSKDALRAARDLEDLLSGQPDHPYAEWLRGVRRDLERRGSKPKKP